MRRTTGFVRAFSILEGLIVLAVLAVVGAVVVGVASQTTKVAETTKLEQDVAALNTAVRVFKANGGKIANSWKIAKVLEELKTKADGETGPKIAGLRGSTLDPRIEAIDETYEEAASGDPKALWDSVNHRFYISEAPIRGVRRFAMNTAKSESVTEERARTVNLALSDGNGWVWNFTDSPSPYRNAPRSPDSAPGADGGGSGNGDGDPLEPGGALVLNEPVALGEEGGIYELVDFPLTFELGNQNPGGSSVVMVSTDGQTWEEYTGPIQIEPGTTVYSYTESQNEEEWADSDIVINTFNFNKVPLQISLAFDKAAYRYGDLGGAFIGAGAPGSGANRGQIALTNPEKVPASLMNSDNFRVQWTYDGSSPLADNASAGAPFSGAWVNQPVPLAHNRWSGDEVTVSAAAKSLNGSYLEDSPVVTRTVGIERIQLRDPVAVTSGRYAALSLASQYLDTPVGARIVYNLNGVDPGNSNGEPVSGQLYTGGEIHVPFGAVLVARTYAPSGLGNWFHVSGPVTVMGSALGDDWLISGNAGGLFSGPTGDSGMVSNITGSQESSYFQWGTRHSTSTTANHSRFTGSLFDNVGVGDSFLLGNMEYRNGTTTLGTNATAVDFSIDIAFLGGAVTKSFDYTFGLYSTPNNTGSAAGDADYFRLASIQSSGTVNIFGEDYRLELSFGQTTSNGFSTIDEFHIFENSTGYGQLWGKIVRF